MLLSQVIQKLQQSETIAFELPTGQLVPAHFHVTEIGLVSKKFIDCGGVLRNEHKINFQLWEENDYDHRLNPDKLLSIIKLSVEKLELTDLEVEVEYQNDTIGKYNLEHNGTHFLLTNTLTACLAEDQCGIPPKKKKVSLSNLNAESSCTPGSGCC